MKKLVAMMMALALILCSVSALAATGLGSVTTVTTTAADGEKNGSVSVDTTMCAVTIDENGVITSITFDVVQPKAAFASDGTVAGDAVTEPKTKVEKQDEYGMVAISPIGKEWYEQAAALENWCIGKTVEQVLAMQTYDKGDGEHTCVSNEPDLVSSCTIDVGSFLKALEKAAAAAK